MNNERLDNQKELPKIDIFTPPAVELLLDPEQAKIAWPEHLSDNKEFLKQVADRQELNQRLDAVISRLPRPDITLQSAVSENHLTESQVAELYVSLSNLLETSSDYKRLVLYLPFEFLPKADWQPESPELKKAAAQFKEAYLAAWNDLLHIHDVRANFVDGDVLEVESRVSDLPRVVKAAHLIPKLVENNLIAIEDVFKLLETSEDETLKQSIADTLPVLADLGFIQKPEIARLKASADPLARNMAILISSWENKDDDKVQSSDITLSTLQNKLREEFSRIDAEEIRGITKKRTAWLKQEKKQQAVKSAAEDISLAIADNKLSAEIVSQLATAEADPTCQLALIEGIRMAVETASNDEALALYDRYRETLLSLWDNDTMEIREALSKTFCRLHGLGILDDQQLDKLDITIPQLAGPFSENLKTMKTEMSDVQDIIGLIESDHELTKFIYPVALIFGSRLKGYGQQNADIDVGVFIKPGTSSDNRGQLQAALRKIFSHEKIQGQVVEFWLEETADGLAVRDFDKPDVSLGHSTWTHVLFGAAWEGDKTTIKQLQGQLLTPYMYDTDKIIYDREARGLYLEEMERDTLHYRLMHKGYSRYFPTFGGISTPHSDLIDGQSTFWDSGYRQTATKLFASRVFLPKISK